MRRDRGGRATSGIVTVVLAAVLPGVLLAVLLLVLGPGSASRAIAGVARPTLVWQSIGVGAERATAHHGDVAVHFFRFDLAHYRADVIVTPRALKTAADARRSSGAVAVVNGGFFDERLRPLGLRISRGQTKIPLRRADWGVLIVRDGRASIVHTREYPQTVHTSTATADAAIEAAVQVGPRLLVRGATLPLRPQRARRTAIALDRTGRQLTVLVVDARVEASELAALLAALGFDSALMLDGGPSTQLSIALGETALDIPGGYPVPDLLAIFRKSRERFGGRSDDTFGETSTEPTGAASKDARQ